MGDVRNAVKGPISEQIKGLGSQVEDLIRQKQDDLQREGQAQRDKNLKSIALLEATKGYIDAVRGALEKY